MDITNSGENVLCTFLCVNLTAAVDCGNGWLHIAQNSCGLILT